jgi:hypothetical protein
VRPPLILGVAAAALVVAALTLVRIAHLGVQTGYAPAQPIAFSHRLHAGANQIPCLYCHFGARTSRHAGIPPASVCVGCHGMLDKQTVAIERIKEAVLVERPLLVWVKVHNLPDFVRFNHSQHVISGVACQRCHGPVETMERVVQVAPLTMGWCLDCHRERAGVPASALRRALHNLAAPAAAPALGLSCVSCHH